MNVLPHSGRVNVPAPPTFVGVLILVVAAVRALAIRLSLSLDFDAVHDHLRDQASTCLTAILVNACGSVPVAPSRDGGARCTAGQVAAPLLEPSPFLDCSAVWLRSTGAEMERPELVVCASACPAE